MAYCNRGLAYSKKGESDKAITDCTEAIRLRPDDAVAYKNRGWAYGNKGEYDRAIADFTEAIRLDPKCQGVLQPGRGLRRMVNTTRRLPTARRLFGWTQTCPCVSLAGFGLREEGQPSQSRRGFLPGQEARIQGKVRQIAASKARSQSCCAIGCAYECASR